MQIGPLRLLIISVIYKLKPGLNVSKLLHLESLAFEIYTPKDSLIESLLAKGS